MADSDLALAMAIAENTDSSQDEDFQLPTHISQLCLLRKLAHKPKRQKKSHCLSKKGTFLQKPRSMSIEGKENQVQNKRRIGSSCHEYNLVDPNLSQDRRPLAPMKPNVKNTPLTSCAESSRGELGRTEAETATDKAHTPTDRSLKVLLDQPSDTHAIEVNASSTDPYLLHYCEKGAGKPPTCLLYSALESLDPRHNQANVRPLSSAVDSMCDGATKQSAHDHHDRHAYTTNTEEATLEESWKPERELAEMAQALSPRPSCIIQGLVHRPAQKDGGLLLATMNGNAMSSSVEEVISLAEEEGLVIDAIEQKQQQFEPNGLEREDVSAFDCLVSANRNPDSQFNALLNLCVDSVSEDDEVDELHVDPLGNTLAAEDGSLLVEELMSSLMTQKRCIESLISSDVDLQPIEGHSEALSKSPTEIVFTTLLPASQKTCLEAQNLSFEDEDHSCQNQDTSDENSHGEEIGVPIDLNLKQPLECPVCGSCITGLSVEQREVHTNACLDSNGIKETHEDAGIPNIDTDQISKSDGKNELGECVQEQCSLDLLPVLRWLETLNLSRYADVFVREEIDWDTLKCLTDEDLITLGITALGPRRKILYTLQQLEKERLGNLVNTMDQRTEDKQQLEADPSGKKLITDFFVLPPPQGKIASSSQAERPFKEKLGRSSGVAARKRILTELTGIPEWMSIPGTKFCVDAFHHLRADCSHWFLTHFHTDHYQGLTRAFRYGHVYCSPITAQLVNMRIGVPWERLKSLPVDQTIEIDGVKVTFIDANHCPGSVMILFEPQNGKAVLHTGDFRFAEDMAGSPVLQACNIHTLILDTTYCNPQYDFPKQEVVIQFIIDAIQAEAFNPSTLFLIGTYTIGKERIFFEVAKALQKKIYCSATKLRLLQCMHFPDEDMKWLTSNDRDAHIHVVPLWSIASFKRMNYIVRQNAGRYNSIVAFSPTGWSFGRGKKRTPGRRWRQGTVVRYEVPYSEHCSFKELRDFVRFVNPVNIIPSVHNESSEAADKLIALLLNEEDVANEKMENQWAANV